MAVAPRTKVSTPPNASSIPARYYPWVRMWVELPADPKLRTVARLSKQPVAVVVAVFVTLLADAANATVRGTPDISAEDIASALDLDTDQVESILKSMQGRLLDGRRLTGWDIRQPLREDDSSDRTRAWRERQARASERSVTHGDATVTQRDASEVDLDLDVYVEIDSREPTFVETLKLRRSGASKNVVIHDPGGSPLGGTAASLVALPLTNGKEASITEQHAGELVTLYPGINVPDQVRAMRGWLLANPDRRKTPRGVLKFVHGWLGREQNRSRGSSTGSTPRILSRDAQYLEQFKKGGMK